VLQFSLVTTTGKNHAPDPAQGQDRLRWTVLVVRLPTDPSRHRVAVWRELRRVGALMLGQGVWAVPATPVFTRSLERAVTLAERGDGEVVLLDAAGRDEAEAARLEGLFTAARQAEWAEFLAECGRYEVEIDKEIRTAKFILAELDEEEQSLDRLRRWYRELKLRDVFGAPAAAEAEQRLKHCAERLDDYADRVYQAVHWG
jgi:hypothetical protein